MAVKAALEAGAVVEGTLVLTKSGRSPGRKSRHKWSISAIGRFFLGAGLLIAATAFLAFLMCLLSLESDAKSSAKYSFIIPQPNSDLSAMRISFC